MNDIYVKFLNAKAVAVAWIGAAIGPTFLWMGLQEDLTGHLIVGIALLTVTTLTIYSGSKAARHGAAYSDKLVHLVLPSFLMLAGIALAYFLSP